MSNLAISPQTPLKRLHGVGEVIERGLERLGISTVQGLLLFFPYRFEDYSNVVQIADLKPGNVTIHATVEMVRLKRTARRGLTIVEAILADETGTTKSIWFNQPYIAQSLKEGQTYYFAGEFAFKSNNLAMQNPTFSAELAGGRGGKIVPIYHENSLVNSNLLTKLVDQAIGAITQLPTILPESIVKQHQLMSYHQAIRTIHQPATPIELAQARRSLAFAELFIFVCAGLTTRQELAQEEALAVPIDEEKIAAFVKSLPFDLTDAQRRVAWQILTDMAQSHPTNRMVQGDVGSGKTAVALIAAVAAAQAGFQTVMMVPTAILANQHVASASQLLQNTSIQTVALTSGLKAAQRQEILKSIEDGTAQLIIGTHSLLHESVKFHNANLVIIDEQHRFGVEQRAQIKKKMQHMPHLITMTATPIPRTLALVLYSELDLSIIDEMPPDRTPIETKLYLEIERANAYAKIDEQITAGHQVYVVCPQIDETDESGIKSVEREYERLQRTVFAHRRVALLHGKLSADEKKRIMSDFLAGDYDILVSTTVVEVGVNVPNATVMMVEDADRFGLATLHQLRGRVGRAQFPSYCYLFTQSNSQEAMSRLQALERTTDGLRLAQIDLINRGAGEFYGTAQHGKLSLKMADLTDMKLVAEVVEAAKSFVGSGGMVQYPSIEQAVSQIRKDTTLN